MLQKLCLEGMGARKKLISNLQARVGVFLFNVMNSNWFSNKLNKKKALQEGIEN